MPDKISISIDVFRDKSAGDFTAALADPEGKLETGSACAYTAALSAALLLRAATVSAAEGGNERAEYIRRNAETLRAYMVHLIDEDVKCRAPLKRALREGSERDIEASRRTAVAIAAEVVNMMGQGLELARELTGLAPKDALHWLGESAELAMAAVRSARLYIVDMGDKSSDETYRFVTRRENEITLSQCAELYGDILHAVEKAV